MRTFRQLDDVADLVPAHFGSDRWLVALDVWADAEVVPDDPFTDADGAELFEVNHAALRAAGVRVPELMFVDRASGLALTEDAGTDFPERQRMLDLAEWNIAKALAAL